MKTPLPRSSTSRGTDPSYASFKPATSNYEQLAWWRLSVRLMFLMLASLYVCSARQGTESKLNCKLLKLVFILIRGYGFTSISKRSNGLASVPQESSIFAQAKLRLWECYLSDQLDSNARSFSTARTASLYPNFRGQDRSFTSLKASTNAGGGE
ncbi:hypothetical protein FA13DRAFT_809738 [Coprinellus micaceus]|uniref:Uncharacterized protein n=1 Tax=Coprinellus micaceus TaxID=71717 RepID=A0A4Y7S4P3_COPMI|nr:hypothetical protein FA13DRAFT_809738 [Coprinellus micaceus]